MTHCRIFFLLVFLLVSYQASAMDDDTEALNIGGLFVDMGGGSDPDVIGGRFGFFGYTTRHLSAQGSISFLASEKLDDVFAGADTGIRLYATTPEALASPFAGIGIFAGYSKADVSADNDDLDNDDDGDIDEPGEKDEVINNIMGIVYPELGIAVRISPDSRMVLSTRYNVTTEGRENDFWLFSMGFEWFFGESYP